MPDWKKQLFDPEYFIVTVIYMALRGMRDTATFLLSICPMRPQAENCWLSLKRCPTSLLETTWFLVRFGHNYSLQPD